MASSAYMEASFKTLVWRECIRLRPGMYIGPLGGGTCQDDGIFARACGPIRRALKQVARRNRR